jgi:hypothetical protein
MRSLESWCLAPSPSVEGAPYVLLPTSRDLGVSSKCIRLSKKCLKGGIWAVLSETRISVILNCDCASSTCDVNEGILPLDCNGRRSCV